MRALDVLDLVEQASSHNDKIRILEENSENQELQDLLDAALNFSRKFHVKKLDDSLGELDGNQARRLGTPYPNPVTPHPNFICMLRVLEQRKVTGHDALRLVNYVFNICGEQEKKWYTRVLLKDLKAGFDISTANKAGFNIPKFDVMLAKDGKRCKKLEQIVKEGVFVSPKLDGYRCIAICNNGEVTLHSRNGTEYVNFPSVIETLQEWCQESRFVLDGEIMSDDFNKMQQSAFASKRGTTVGDVIYHVFGFVPYDEWVTDNFRSSTADRLKNLASLFDKQQPHHTNMCMVPQCLTHDPDKIAELEQQFLADGYEGAMVLPNIPYFRGRKSNKLMKFKTNHSQDCRVLDAYEGTGKYEGMLGGLRVLQEDGETTCDVGSGFSDEDREYIWNNQADFINRVAELKYQDLTPDGKMRFPIFVRWRDRGDGSKI